MASYRLYFLDDEGVIRHVLAFECGGDDEAMDLIEPKLEGRPAELWSLARQVKVYGALSSGAGLGSGDDATLRT
ncbi:MAG TPA: hypothetical protein VGB49_01395 [Caulobacteraceae bacterium]|jgi:hypothetical protein